MNFGEAILISVYPCGYKNRLSCVQVMFALSCQKLVVFCSGSHQILQEDHVYIGKDNSSLCCSRLRRGDYARITKSVERTSGHALQDTHTRTIYGFIIDLGGYICCRSVNMEYAQIKTWLYQFPGCCLQGNSHLFPTETTLPYSPLRHRLKGQCHCHGLL